MLDAAPLPLLVLPEYVLLPGTLVPFHAVDEGPRRLFGAALADRRLLVVASSADPGVAALGRIVSDRRYPDGRIDVFVHALERVRVDVVSDGPDGLLASVSSCPDIDESPVARAAAERLRLLALALAAALADGARAEEAEALRAVAGSTSGCGLLANRLGSALIADPAERKTLLETTSPEARADRLVALLGMRWLEAVGGEMARC